MTTEVEVLRAACRLAHAWFKERLGHWGVDSAPVLSKQLRSALDYHNGSGAMWCTRSACVCPSCIIREAEALDVAVASKPEEPKLVICTWGKGSTTLFDQDCSCVRCSTLRKYSASLKESECS